MVSRRLQLTSGIELHAIEEGSGQPLLMIPGWSQTAAAFGRNIEPLARHRRVVALDMRGHGDSDKPAHGYRIARLAVDLSEAMDALQLSGQVDLLGHSMGASVIWSYLDLFGSARLRRLVLVDQAPMAATLPGWSEADRQRYGSFLPDLASVGALCAKVRAATSVEAASEILRGMFTDRIPQGDFDWIVKENLKFPREHAADLLFDHLLNDWRDIIQAIRLPTLVIGGRASFFDPASQEWIASCNPAAECRIFTADEGGAHFMFYENSNGFNEVVDQFLTAG